MGELQETGVVQGQSADAAPQSEARSRILAAAREIFSIAGFDSTSLRSIAARAGVQHQLVVYHFKTKDALWRAAISSLFEPFTATMRHWLAIRDAEGPATALRIMVSDFVMFTALHPEYHRISTFEGRTENERLRWLLEEHVRPLYETSTSLIVESQRAGIVRAGHAGQLHYAVIGIATTGLVFAPEYRLMTGFDSFERDQIDRIVELVWDFLAPAKTAA